VQGHRYALRLTGLVPGTHDLRAHFVTQEGAPVAGLPPVLVQIAGELPADHQGQLALRENSGIEIFGVYRRTIAGVAALWVFLGIVLVARRRPRAPEIAPAPQPQSIDRIPPVRLDLDFTDKHGPVVLPAESAPLALDARPEHAASRLLTDIEATHILDDRAKAEGSLTLEVKATARGLVARRARRADRGLRDARSSAPG
jgi:hypothetical protein